MTKTGDLIFIDSNCLVSFLDEAHPEHKRMINVFRDWSNEKLRFAISPQVIGETFRTLTSSSYTSGPISAEVFNPLAERVITNESVVVFSPGVQAIRSALEAAVELNVSSHRIYDLILYGTMLEHGVTRIATFNVKHFRDLNGIELVPIP